MAQVVQQGPEFKPQYHQKKKKSMQSCYQHVTLHTEQAISMKQQSLLSTQNRSKVANKSNFKPLC
jgi:hypothetical protein